MKLKNRILSIDIFRGMTIAFMIVVNTPGSWSFVYAPLEHAKWHGWTPTDLVFPFFLFIMGVSMAFSFAKYEYTWSSSFARKMFRRWALILLIGWFLRAFPFTNFDIGTFRWMGVLPRIAWVYLLSALLIASLSRKYLLLVAACILMGYWWLMWYGGGDNPYGLETNFARRIDLLVLGEHHLWRGLGIPFDPEGILSTLPAVVTTLSGYLFGRAMKQYPINIQFVRAGTALGLAFLVLAYLWNVFFPINKSLWTSSYVLLTSGLGIIVLLLLTYFTDMLKWRKGSYFFLVFGRNALMGFIFSIFFVKVMLYLWKMPIADGSITTGYHWLFIKFFQPLFGNYPGSLLFAVSYTMLIWSILYWMDKKGYFVKI